MTSGYYLTTGKQKLGPLTEKNVIDGVRSGKISLFDMILNNQTGEWMMLAQHPDFSDLESDGDGDSSENDYGDHVAVGLISDVNEDTQVPAFITPENFPILTPVYWYEKNRGDHPLKYLEILALVHEHKLSETSLISKSPQGPWQKLIDWEEFSPKSLENYKQISGEKLPDVKMRRKSPRFNCGKVFIALSSKGSGFQVFCPDVSRTGMGLIVRTAKCDLNETLMIKFSDSITDNKFDAKGVVVSVRKVKLPGAENVYIRYGIRFTHLSETGKKFIATLPKE
ncbi:PilZ domain-containing protein [Bdellovibrio sp. 22V]|uniref:PilZ domain-containing protein n=1 Tax=Bdellovibrio TaxID=958 RepID=UPI002543AD65|nr:PilZ domain-containing protein [Bdellovibrio sp. 22V]WII72067.1 PilZ domain-containing protein [Bdellovibrio sp. 22V]